MCGEARASACTRKNFHLHGGASCVVRNFRPAWWSYVCGGKKSFYPTCVVGEASACVVGATCVVGKRASTPPAWWEKLLPAWWKKSFYPICVVGEAFACVVEPPVWWEKELLPTAWESQLQGACRQPCWVFITGSIQPTLVTGSL